MISSSDLDARLTALETFVTAIAARMSADTGHSFLPLLEALRTDLPQRIQDKPGMEEFRKSFVHHVKQLEVLYEAMTQAATRDQPTAQ